MLSVYMTFIFQIMLLIVQASNTYHKRNIQKPNQAQRSYSDKPTHLYNPLSAHVNGPPKLAALYPSMID